MNEFVLPLQPAPIPRPRLPFYRVLELAVAHPPVRYRELVADPKPKLVPPKPPGGGGHPPSLDRPRADRPWRRASSALVRSAE